MKRTSVILDPKIVLMADEKHQRIFHQGMNFSDFFRHCLEAWVFAADDPRPVWQQASDLVEQMKKEVAAQKQILNFESQQAQEKAAKDKVRFDLITESVRTEVLRIGPDRFRKYLMDDPYGDYQNLQEDILHAVSKTSGYAVDLADVIQAFKEVRA